MTTCCANICKQSIHEDIDHKALIDIRFMYRLHIMHPCNPRDERRHYPIILHGLKHIGVMETPETSGLESSSCFLPSAGVDPCDELIQLSPSSCGSGFLVNGVGRMICSMWRPTAAEAINRQTPRAKGAPNRARSGLGQSAQSHFGLVRPQFPPRLLLA
jgi:hypothetical protein